MTSDPSNVIEPLDLQRHDRAAFRSGVEPVDNFFERTAGKLARADNARTFVMTNPGGELIGFYATNAHSIRYSELPSRFARARAGHGNVPAAFIAMIAVDRRFQGRGFGSDLLIDCLARMVDASAALGIAVVLLDVLDCGDPVLVARRRALYLSFGFQPLPAAPMRLFMSMATARSLVRGAGAAQPSAPLGADASRSATQQ